MDKLGSIFKVQQKLEEALGFLPVEDAQKVLAHYQGPDGLWRPLPSSDPFSAKFTDQSLNLIREVCEALDEVPGTKHWKKGEPPLDREKLLEELVDVFHFLVSLFILSGYSAEEVHQAYLNKNFINHVRSLSNY